MAIHSSVLAWEILWTEEPGGLQSTGSQRVRDNWSDLACVHKGNASYHHCFLIHLCVRPLDCKEIQPVHSEGDQPWHFFGRNDAKAETLVLWPPHAKSWLIGRDSDAGRDWGQEEKGTTEEIDWKGVDQEDIFTEAKQTSCVEFPEEWMTWGTDYRV